MALALTYDLNRIRIDHIGSLVRPAKLKDVFARYDRGQASKEELAKAQDEAIRGVIQKQEAHGFPVVTDGEFRRHSFQESFSECVTGFDVPKNISTYYEKRDLNENPFERAEQNFNEAGPAIVTRRSAVERLKLTRNLPLEEFRYAGRVARVPAKVTLIGPDRVAQRFKWETSLNVYKGLDDFVEHVVAIQRQMIGDIVTAGCKYIQIDAPGYTAYVDPDSLAAMRSRGEEPMANLKRSIEADNQVIASFPGILFGIHICRGNRQSMWHREGHYAISRFKADRETPEYIGSQQDRAEALTQACSLAGAKHRALLSPSAGIRDYLPFDCDHIPQKFIHSGINRSRSLAVVALTDPVRADQGHLDRPIR